MIRSSIVIIIITIILAALAINTAIAKYKSSVIDNIFGTEACNSVLVQSWHTEHRDGQECVVVTLDPAVCDNLTDTVVCTVDRMLRAIAASGRSFRFEGPCRFDHITAANVIYSGFPYGCPEQDIDP
jgi:hypothetical protein